MNENKLTLLMRCPCASLTGYGQRAKDLAYSLIKSNKYDVYLESCGWGTLPLNGLEKDNEKNNIIKDTLKKGIIKNPDIFITHTIPNEFERRGTKLNLGISALNETDRVPIEFLQKCNEMDGTIVSSKHCMQILQGSSYTIFSDPEKKNPVSQESSKKPAAVVFEGVDTTLYNDSPYVPIINPSTNEELKFGTDFNFLFVGHWLQGGMNEDRKNVAKLVRIFMNQFIHRKDIGLVLKTATGSNSIVDLENIKKKINEIRMNEGITEKECPPIYIIHGDLTDNELASLYKHPQIKAFVTLTHGEGYGRPIAEAAACNLPIICTGWSGQLDFLDLRYSYYLKYDMVPVPKSVIWPGVIPEGSNWSEPNEKDVEKAFNYIINNYETAKKEGDTQGKIIREKFNLDKMQELLVNTIEELYQIKQKSTQQISNIQLPKLKKLEMPKNDK